MPRPCCKRSRCGTTFQCINGEMENGYCSQHVLGYLFPILRGKTGPEVIKLFSCSTQLSMKFYLLINVKMPTIVGILTLSCRKNSIIGLSGAQKKQKFLIFLYL